MYIRPVFWKYQYVYQYDQKLETRNQIFKHFLRFWHILIFLWYLSILFNLYCKLIHVSRFFLMIICYHFVSVWAYLCAWLVFLTTEQYFFPLLCCVRRYSNVSYLDVLVVALNLLSLSFKCPLNCVLSSL